MLAGDAYPYVDSIQLTGSTPTSSSTISYAVTFSEPVTGVDANDFQLVLSQVGPSAKIESISPASNFYASTYAVVISNVAVSGIAASGTLGLNLVDNGSIHSAANHPLRVRNAGASFAQQRQVATGLRPNAITQADLNKDGNADLVVTNADRNTVSVLLGKGDGGFLPQQMFATGLRPGGVTLGDFNQDSILDLAVSNSVGNTVSVLLGKGDGSFLPQQRFATGLRPSALTLGDLNSDRQDDLAITNSGGNTVSVLLGKSDGSFLPQQRFIAGLTPSAVKLDDLNGDGNADLAVTNAGGNTVSVLLGKGDGSLLPQQRFVTGLTPSAVVIGDFNKDGRPDMGIPNASRNTVSVLLCNANGNATGDVATIIPAQVLPVTVGNWSAKDQYLHPNSPTDWWWNTGTLTTKEGRTFGFEINTASFRYEGPLTQGFAFTQVLLTDVKTNTVYQSSTRYLANKVALNIPVFDGSGTYDPTTWAESNSTKAWSVSLGGGLTGIANQLSKIDVVDGGMFYSAGTTVKITPVDGNGSGATAQAVIREGQIVQIQLLSAGTGYTAPPTVTIRSALPELGFVTVEARSQPMYIVPKS